METEERIGPEGYTQAALEALADIALGRKSYPARDKDGREVPCQPTVAERLKALELLSRWSGEAGTGARADAPPSWPQPSTASTGM